MFTLTWNWDWLLTKEDRRLIAQAKAQEQAEQEKTAIFIERLNKIEPRTVVTEIRKLHRQIERDHE